MRTDQPLCIVVFCTLVVRKFLTVSMRRCYRTWVVRTTLEVAMRRCCRIWVLHTGPAAVGVLSTPPACRAGQGADDSIG